MNDTDRSVLGLHVFTIGGAIAVWALLVVVIWPDLLAIFLGEVPQKEVPGLMTMFLMKGLIALTATFGLLAVYLRRMQAIEEQGAVDDDVENSG